MAASIVQATRQVIGVKNANAANSSQMAGQYGFLINDARRSLWEVVEAVLEADEEIVLAILETVGHWARVDYLADSATIAHGGEIPTHQGEIGKVLIQRSSGAAFLPAKGRRSASDIERYRANTANGVYGATVHTDAGSPLAGLYDISEEDLLFYTGFSAKVQIANFTRALRTVTDAGITSGLKALGSATAAFVAGDVGSLAVIAGAGASGVDFASEIRAVGGPTAATLADAAGATASNAVLWVAACQSPAAYLSGVVAKALPKLFKEGDDTGLQAINEKRAAEADMRVRRNARALPDVVTAERAA